MGLQTRPNSGCLVVSSPLLRVVQTAIHGGLGSLGGEIVLQPLLSEVTSTDADRERLGNRPGDPMPWECVGRTARMLSNHAPLQRLLAESKAALDDRLLGDKDNSWWSERVEKNAQTANR